MDLKFLAHIMQPLSTPPSSEKHLNHVKMIQRIPEARVVGNSVLAPTRVSHRTELVNDFFRISSSHAPV